MLPGGVRAKEGSPSGLALRVRKESGDLPGRKTPPETPGPGYATTPEGSPLFSACWKMMMTAVVEVRVVVVTVTVVTVVTVMTVVMVTVMMMVTGDGGDGDSGDGGDGGDGDSAVVMKAVTLYRAEYTAALSCLCVYSLTQAR